MNDPAGQDYESMWESAGRRMSASLDGRSAAALLGDDPIATAAVALGLSRIQAMRRRVFLADLLGEAGALSALVHTDDVHGVSDMIRYGVSLGHVAHPVKGTPNLFVIAGGTESPLADDVLSDRRWTSLVEQLRATDAVLLIAAPSIAPSLTTLVSRLDGILLVGDAMPPGGDARVLGEVKATSAVRVTPPTPRLAYVASGGSAPRGWSWVVAVLTLLAVGGALTFPQWRSRAGFGNPAALRSDAGDSAAPQKAAPAPSTRTRSDATYSVELLFTNSERDALNRLASARDSLPAATFVATTAGADSARWYRLLSGAFPDSSSAETFLSSLRARGTVAAGAGSVARTPFALLLDSASSDALARTRVTAYRGRGVPAYALRDSLGVWRVYTGAFASVADARLPRRQLDSLNIQSTLATRVGSSS